MSPQRVCYFPLRDGKPAAEGTRYVGRGSRWGNRHPVASVGRCELCDTDHSATEAVAAYRRDLPAGDDLVEWLKPLREARFLGCACELGNPCHGDLLVELLEAVEP